MLTLAPLNERIRLGLTQSQLAERLEVHEKHICKIETGHQNVTIKTLSKIAKALETDECTLLIHNKKKLKKVGIN